MTVAIDELKENEWYDGFTWYSGSQKGTATMQWGGTYFHSEKNQPFHHVDDARNKAWSWSFEPNVVSIGEPAA